MRKRYTLIIGAALCASLFIYKWQQPSPDFVKVNLNESIEEDEEKEGYSGPWQRDSLEAVKMLDPALGYAPTMRLGEAVEYIEELKQAAKTSRTTSSLSWQERGPIYDTVGPSNGNGRGGGVGVTQGYTAGRIRAVLVDTLNDPTGNTVITGGVSGGLWRTTNFLADIPNWKPVNDNFDNMAIASITQDPINPRVMYFATGEATSNADAAFGRGVWKSNDGGLTWAMLPSTKNIIRNFKILCDAAGNVYLATRVLTAPIEQPYGLLRSKDGGNTWTNITPRNLTSNAICTDIEISSTGKLHASFGYLGTVVNHRFTSDPANVTPTTWNSGVGIRQASVTAIRMEITTQADILYAVTVNSANNADSIYKSIDGGSTWTRQNSTVLPTAVANGQGWYNLTISINPLNSAEIIVGGLDAYRSLNSGQTVSRLTFWAGVGQYVHADHHYMEWWIKDGLSTILIGCDGGLYLSRNAGSTWMDKNRNLAIKQFYATTIHPAAGSPYMLAGAQDNGVHQLNKPGLDYSIEVTGGDGAYVHINQKDPQIQFGSYIYNQYRRSTNGGQSWQGLNWSGSAGLFINPFDYDDETNTMYASWTANNIFRWIGAHNSTNNAVLIPAPSLGTATALKVSENVPNRVFVGSNTGRIYRLDNSSTTPTITNITGANFPTGYINCVNAGSTDDFLVAVFTNFGLNNVWYSTNGGTSWMPIDGNLPDMPVRWAVFHPQYNNRLFLGTEAGVFSTDAIDGANTVWTPEIGFPTVRTTMLKIRKSDNTLAASTHGRGLWTASIPVSDMPEINFDAEVLKATEIAEITEGCRGYKDYKVSLSVMKVPAGNADVTFSVLGGNTARQGVDFDFTTNGNFAKPDNKLVFQSGSSNKQEVSIRIYDDAEVESAESFKLAFTVSGATNAKAGSVNSFEVTIRDNDKLPTVSASTFQVGDFNSQIIAASPLAGNRIKHKTQSLFTAKELHDAGILTTSKITSMAFNVLAKNSTRPFKGFTIAMAHTSANAMAQFAPHSLMPASAFTEVYSGDYQSAPGSNVFNFATPFQWDGVSNVIVQICFDNAEGPVDLAADFLEGNSYPLGLLVRSSVYANYASGNVSGCALPAAFVTDFRFNASFGVDYGITTIASALNSQKTEYLNAGNDIYFYPALNRILARVKNLSNNNYACTNVSIDRTGTSATRFWSADKRSFLMDKTYQIAATANKQSGPYEVTLYFTKEEKEGWEKATGNAWKDIQLVRVSGKISDVTPSNAQPNNNGTVQEVVNAVKGTFGSGYTLTGTFNGFGGIGAGMPGRQFTVLIVKANGNNGNGNNSNARSGTPSGITVEWSTSSETNSSYFEIEKSYDGNQFSKIATVKAAGNKATESNYRFVDSDNTQVNYYRITLHHADNTVLMSNTVVVRNDAAQQQMFVLSNPFRNDIRLRFARVPETPVSIRVVDMQGRVVRSYMAPAGSNLITVDMNAIKVMSGGVYELDVTIDGKQYRSKLVKQ